MKFPVLVSENTSLTVVEAQTNVTTKEVKITVNGVAADVAIGEKCDVTNDTSPPVTEAEKSEASEQAVVSKCCRKITENGNANDGDSGEKPALQNGKLDAGTDDEKMDEMFTDDMVNDMKQELVDDAKTNTEENNDEFTDQCDQQDSDALELKMKNSEKNEALQLFQQGKRNMLIEDFEAAVDTLALACEKYRMLYGEQGVECGEVYLVYGNALFQLWRTEELNNQKEDEDLSCTNKSANNEIVEGENEDEDAEKNDEQNEIEASETTGEEAVEERSEVSEETAEGDVESEKTEEPTETEKSAGEEVAQPKDEATGESGDENDEEDDEEEDVDNLQLAWEVFETVKNIYTKHDDNANLAKVLMKLGEVSIASGNYELAIEDLRSCLAILNKLTPVKPRQIADTYFQLFTAYSANYNLDRAENELRNAKNTLDEQLHTLQGKLTDVAADSDEAKQIGTEISELETLTKDMEEKLIEFKASTRQIVSTISSSIKNKIEDQKTTPSIGEAAGSSGSKSSNAPDSSSNAPVNNISHLVRKKPKSSEETKLNGETKSNEDTQAAEVVKSNPAIEGSQSCKRKADDEVDATEPSAKKACVS